MFETLVDVFLDALIDSLKILPFLFGVYLLIVYRASFCRQAWKGS